MAFTDLAELGEGRTLPLPIDGRVYVIQDVDGETGLWAQQLLEIGWAAHAGREVDGSVLNDEQEHEAYRRLLGDAIDDMLTDGVKWDRIKHCFYTTLIWVTVDLATAEKHWLTYGQPDAEGEEEARPNRASRRGAAAAARTTKPRASTSGTRASKASPRQARPGAASSKPGSS